MNEGNWELKDIPAAGKAELSTTLQGEANTICDQCTADELNVLGKTTFWLSIVRAGGH